MSERCLKYQFCVNLLLNSFSSLCWPKTVLIDTWKEFRIEPYSSLWCKTDNFVVKYLVLFLCTKAIAFFLFRKWRNWVSSEWKMSLRLLGPAFSLVVSSSVETTQQSPILLLKVRPFYFDLIIRIFKITSFFWMWSKNVVKSGVFVKVLCFLRKP